MARRLMDAYAWAESDPYRAVTHNKGIMNGIDAVAVATGQDWRAIEAACHSYAALKQDGYGSLTKYAVETDAEGVRWFCGQLALPIAVGTKGGSILSNPVLKYTHGLMSYPDSSTLAQIMVAVGLAQNFAALRALVSEGIQRGHMSLHARNIAIAAGVAPELAGEVAAHMVNSGHINLDAAKEYLLAYDIHKSITALNIANDMPMQAPVSCFIFQESLAASDADSLSLNVVFKTLTAESRTVKLTPTCSTAGVVFGEKSHADVTLFLALAKQLSLTSTREPRQNIQLQRRLKLLAILMHLLLRRLLATKDAEVTRNWIDGILGRIGDDTHMFPTSTFSNAATESLRIAHPLMLAFWQSFEFQISQNVSMVHLRDRIITTHRGVLRNVLHRVHDGAWTDVMRSYAHRFLMPLLLMIDAVVFDDVLVNAAFVDWLISAGEVLDVEIAVAHDLSRFDRDTQSSADNTAVWFVRRNPSSQQQDALEAYVRESLGAQELDMLAEDAKQFPSDLQCATLLTGLPAIIRQWYGVNKWFT